MGWLMRLFFESDIQNAIMHGFVFCSDYCDKNGAVMSWSAQFSYTFDDKGNRITVGGNDVTPKATYAYRRYRLRRKEGFASR